MDKSQLLALAYQRAAAGLLGATVAAHCSAVLLELGTAAAALQSAAAPPPVDKPARRAALEAERAEWVAARAAGKQPAPRADARIAEIDAALEENAK